MPTRAEIIASELANDPTTVGYSGMPTAAAKAAAMNARPLVANPVPQPNLRTYTFTGSVVDAVTATKFVNAIPPAQLLAIKTDSAGVGGILYDRLMALEASGGDVHLGEAALVGGAQYCLGEGFISQATYDALMGYSDDPDPNWPAQVPGVSRSETLGVYPVLAQEIA